jgi:hypothetical protein
MPTPNKVGCPIWVIYRIVPKDTTKIGRVQQASLPCLPCFNWKTKGFNQNFGKDRHLVAGSDRQETGTFFTKPFYLYLTKVLDKLECLFVASFSPVLLTNIKLGWKSLFTTLF